jgi:ketosteroid isomerase-like protein
MLRLLVMPTRPEELHPALSTAFNAGDLESILALYDPKAVFVIKPDRVTNGPEELRAALGRLIELRGHLAIHPDAFIRSDDLVLVLGKYTLTGRRRDGTPLEIESRFADVLRQQPDGRWLLAIDNAFGGD